MKIRITATLETELELDPSIYGPGDNFVQAEIRNLTGGITSIEDYVENLDDIEFSVEDITNANES